MIFGMNSAPVGMRPYPLCVVCDALTYTEPCAERTRLYYSGNIDQAIAKDGDVVLYREKDAASVECLGCLKSRVACGELTFDTARTQLYVDSGNVYARITGGRANQVIELIASITLNSGKEIHLNKSILIER
jgi:hypothetical protein